MPLHRVARFGAIWQDVPTGRRVQSIDRMRINRMPAEPNLVPPAEDRLDSWKEIAAYLRKGVRTVQRWERTDGLPVRRLGQGSVFAYKTELDAWWKSQSRRLEEEPEPAIGSSPAVRAFAKWPYALVLVLA